MKKISKRLLSLLLAMVMVFSMAACGQSEDRLAELEGLSYDEKSAVIYEDALGEFASVYDTAKTESTSVSERFALMAIAEAKLLASAVMLPLSADGGNYAISRVAPNTVDYSLWGNDSDRVHNAIVATELISAEHRAEMKAKWNEVKGTGTYEDWVKTYLADKGYTIKDSYTAGYSADPQTWDVLATSEAADSELIVQTYDGLLEYDCEGVLQPALAESYTVSEDGLVYTFKIREGAVWVDNQGRKVDDVTADDFVAGMQHMMDSMGGLEYLLEGVIVNATEYIYQEITDFSQVGVKAVDDYTLEYTLCEPKSFFLTMLGYGVFAPMSRTYYESKGGKFGAEYDPSAETYTYGTSPENIAYCGPFLVTNATEKNTIVFKENTSYWNAANTNLKSYTLLYNDGTEATKAYNDTLSGTIDGAGLNSSALELAKQDGNFEKYAYVSMPDATSFMAFYNINREAFANYNDDTKVVSPQSEEDAARTNAAMNNVHFRRAISFALDRGAWNAQVVGEELKYVSLRNSFIPGTFLTLEEEVTVEINGKDKTFPAGTWYGEIVQAQLDADDVAIVAFDPTADDGVGSSDGYDGWFNADAAKEEMKKAVKELKKEEGVEISAENPIQLDIPYFAGSEAYSNRANAYKQSLETVLEGQVKINLVVCNDIYEWYYAGYWPETGAESNYDVCDISGWGPDYGDPQTYLDTMLSDYAGYMTKCLGIY